MDGFSKIFAVFLGAAAVVSCAGPPAPDSKVAGPEVRRMAARRVSAVIVTRRSDLAGWVHQGFKGTPAPGDAEGGSAAPISPDGYFLTADHVLAIMDGRNVFVIHGRNGALTPSKARVVWRSESADLALLKISSPTPDYYRWSPADQWLPAGTPVIHGGIATGFKSQPGKLNTAIPPESGFGRSRKFKLDIPFQPGDSGGPVVDAYGRLVGINSAVEFIVPMETAFFVDSEANRPNLAFLDSLIREDRARNIGGGATVD